MSWFTATADSKQPMCPRCHRPQFVRLVSSSKDFTVWDCVGCGPVKQPERKA